MKNINLSNVICSVFLGIAFITGCLIISVNQSSSSNTIEKHNSDNPLMTIKETAEYLNISESQVREIISSEETILKTSGTFSVKMFPIIKIGNDIFVSSVGLHDWISESSQQRIQY